MDFAGEENYLGRTKDSKASLQHAIQQSQGTPQRGIFGGPRSNAAQWLAKKRGASMRQKGG